MNDALRVHRYALASAIFPFLLFAAWISKESHLQWDAAVLTFLNAWQMPELIAATSAVTWLGSLAFLLPLAVVVAWRFDSTRGWRSWAFLPVAVLGASGLAHAIKFLVDRERPEIFPSLIPTLLDASFPSAHAMQITAFVVAWLLGSNRLQQAGQILAGMLLILIVGFSRLYLQVHFPSDVVFGMLAGTLWVLMLRALPVWRRID